MPIVDAMTEARVRFNETLRKVESDVDIVIEKNGVPAAALISPWRYEWLKNGSSSFEWLERAARSREMVCRLRGGARILDVDEMINFGHDV